MEDQRFDALTRALAHGSSRRTAIKVFFGGLTGGLALTSRTRGAGAQTCQSDTECSGGFCCNGECHQCCDADDCFPNPFENQCTVPICRENGLCDVVSSCGINQFCCASGTPEHYCADCCSDDQCGPCQVCSNGECIYPVSIPNGLCCGTEGNYYCAACCDDSNCPGCQSCVSGECVSNCGAGERCCGTEGNEYCAVCCNDDDCGDCAYCSLGNCYGECSQSETCCEDECVAIGTCCQASGDHCAVTDGPGTQGNCCDDLLCCPGGEGGSCAECCGDSDCGPCAYCSEGVCYGECSQSETCCNGTCVADDACCNGEGSICGVAPTDDSSQLDCCDGLVCCDNLYYGASVCAECCVDADCAKGGWCDDGTCTYPHVCKDDKHCPRGTCCCKDGTCSGKCCHKPHPPKPPRPAPPAPVTTLPATGAGKPSDSSGTLGAATLGAAAALYAANKLRADRETTTPLKDPEAS